MTASLFIFAASRSLFTFRAGISVLEVVSSTDMSLIIS